MTNNEFLIGLALAGFDGVEITDDNRELAQYWDGYGYVDRYERYTDEHFATHYRRCRLTTRGIQAVQGMTQIARTIVR